MRPGAVAVGMRVVDAHDHRVRDLTRTRWSSLAAHVSDDDRPVAVGEL